MRIFKNYIFLLAFAFSAVLRSPPVGAGEASDRMVQFPKDRGVGVLYLRKLENRGELEWENAAKETLWRNYATTHTFSPDSEEWTKFSDAAGDVSIPRRHEVRLVVNPTAGKDISFLSVLGPTDLQEIDFSLCPVSDDKLASLKGLASVRSIVLSRTLISDAGLEYLKGLASLQTLDVSGTQIGDDGLAHLTELPSVRNLVLSNTRISDSGLLKLKDLRALQTLDISHTQIGNDGLSIVSTLPSLQILDVSYTKVGDKGLSHLERLTSLRMMGCRYTQVSNAGLAYLKKLTSLRVLTLGGNLIGDAGMAYVQGLTSLRLLDLGHTQITNKGLLSLTGLTSLRELNATDTRVSDAALEELARALPDCIAFDYYWPKRIFEKILISISVILVLTFLVLPKVSLALLQGKTPNLVLLLSFVTSTLIWTVPVFVSEMLAFRDSRLLIWYRDFSFALELGVIYSIAILALNYVDLFAYRGFVNLGACTLLRATLSAVILFLVYLGSCFAFGQGHNTSFLFNKLVGVLISAMVGFAICLMNSRLQSKIEKADSGNLA